MSQASFLDLPVELRLHILGYLLLGGPQMVQAHKQDMNDPKITPPDGDWCYPAILRTNQQIHNEGVSLLYESKIFEAIIHEDGLSLCSCFYLNMSRQQPKLQRNFASITGLDLHLKVPKSDLMGDSHRNIHEYSFNLSQWVGLIARLLRIRDLRVNLEPSSGNIEGTKGYARSTHGHEHAAILLDRFKHFRDLKKAIFNVDIGRLLSPDLRQHLVHLSTLVCSNNPVTTRNGPEHKLYSIYLGCYDHIFYKSPSTKQKFHKRITSPLWRKIHCQLREQAWNACNGCDLQAFGVVLQDTKTKWQEWEGEDDLVTHYFEEMENYIEAASKTSSSGMDPT